MTFPNSRHAHVVGLGLIGASVALALKDRGWSVTGVDSDAATVTAAIAGGVVAGTERSADVELVVIATPAGLVARLANEALASLESATVIVTDVAGVKGSIVAHVDDERFLGGHPMAGSELRGLSGARAENRDGFQHLVSEVALGRAGIVLGLEASRLARNNADWHQLLQLCALSQCLIGDDEAVYDPTHFNENGARAMADLVMKQLPVVEPSLKVYLK